MDKGMKHALETIGYCTLCMRSSLYFISMKNYWKYSTELKAFDFMCLDPSLFRKSPTKLSCMGMWRQEGARARPDRSYQSGHSLGSDFLSFARERTSENIAVVKLEKGVVKNVTAKVEQTQCS